MRNTTTQKHVFAVLQSSPTTSKPSLLAGANDEKDKCSNARTYDRNSAHGLWWTCTTMMQCCKHPPARNCTSDKHWDCSTTEKSTWSRTHKHSHTHTSTHTLSLTRSLGRQNSIRKHMQRA